MFGLSVLSGFYYDYPTWTDSIFYFFSLKKCFELFPPWILTFSKGTVAIQAPGARDWYRIEVSNWIHPPTIDIIENNVPAVDSSEIKNPKQRTLKNPCGRHVESGTSTEIYIVLIDLYHHDLRTVEREK